MELCLCMIVKDEAKVIARCIASVKKYITYYVIVDTGSTDDTIKIAKKALNGVPGRFINHKYDGSFDFAKARNRYITAVKSNLHTDGYILVMDADEELVGNPIEAICLDPGAKALMYSIPYMGNLDFASPALLQLNHPWYYKYSIHEYPHSAIDPSVRPVKLSGISKIHHQDTNKDERLRQNLELSQKAVEADPGDTRAVFYLANSYWDMRDYGAAAEHYSERTQMGGWDQEVYMSYLRLALCNKALGKDELFVFNALKAYSIINRPDALYYLGEYYNRKDYFQTALMFLRAAKSLLKRSDSDLFFYIPIEAYLIDIEIAVSLYYLGEYRNASAMNERVLEMELPQSIRDTVVSNEKFCRQALGENS